MQSKEYVLQVKMCKVNAKFLLFSRPNFFHPLPFPSVPGISGRFLRMLLVQISETKINQTRLFFVFLADTFLTPLTQDFFSVYA